MRFSIIARLALIAVLICGFAAPAHAVDCSNAQLRAQMSTDASNRAKTLQQNIARDWKAPAAFNSLYCGAQISSIFNSIGTGLGAAFYSMVQTLLTNLVNQACASAIAPIQNAASQLCIPFFGGLNFNINLGLPGTSLNMCSGTQLLTVTPVSGMGATPAQSFTTIPKLP